MELLTAHRSAARATHLLTACPGVTIIASFSDGGVPHVRGPTLCMRREGGDAGRKSGAVRRMPSAHMPAYAIPLRREAPTPDPPLNPSLRGGTSPGLPWLRFYDPDRILPVDAKEAAGDEGFVVPPDGRRGRFFSNRAWKPRGRRSAASGSGGHARVNEHGRHGRLRARVTQTPAGPTQRQHRCPRGAEHGTPGVSPESDPEGAASVQRWPSSKRPTMRPAPRSRSHSGREGASAASPAGLRRGGKPKDHCRALVRRCAGVTERSDYVAQHT
jgi:hypothetical protein